MCKKLIPVFFLVLCLTAQSQDMQLTQFYAAPTYLNPAFTGMHGCTRISSNYRIQWPSIPGAFVSNVVTLDHALHSQNSGIGLMVTNDRAGSGRLRSNSYNLLYAYEVQLSKKLFVRGGLQGNYTIRDINFSSLVFGDQIARDNAATSIEEPNMAKNSYLDFGSGILAYTQKYWVGFAAHHLNTPNQTLISGGNSPLPLKYSLHAGAKIPIKDNESKDMFFNRQYIYPAINYKAQNKFDQVDVGFYYDYAPMMLGIWYRGIPMLKAYDKGYANNDAIALIAGFTMDNFKFGYSYDFTVSRLAFNTGGAHELSIAYQFCEERKKKKSRKRLLVPCPKF